MYSEDGYFDEGSSSSDESFSDEDSLKSESSVHLGDEDVRKKDSSSEGQADMEDEDILWNPRDIELKDVPDEKPNIKDMIKKYITDPKNADCVVTVRGKEFRCHRLLLQCYSNYFRKCSGNCMELNFPSVTPDMFSELYTWMLGSQHSYKRILQPKTIVDVLIASSELGIRKLEEQCWAVFNSELVFNEETAYAMFLEAKQKSCDFVADIMLPRIREFFAQLAASDDFVKLPAGYVVNLLDSVHIRVPSEAHVFAAALRWLAHDWDSRLPHAIRIMACVRFQFMFPLELVIIRRTQRNSELRSIMEIPEVQQMVEEGLQYAVLLLASGTPALQSGQPNDLLEQLEFRSPKPRHYTCTSGENDSIGEMLDDFVDLDTSESKHSARGSSHISVNSKDGSQNNGSVCLH